MQQNFSIEQVNEIYSGWFKKLQSSGKNYNEYLLILIRASGRYLGVYEEWRDVVDYEGLYRISDFGRVESIERGMPMPRNGKYCIKKWSGKKLKPNISGGGYLGVCLSKNSKHKTHSIHILVAKMFLSHIPNGHNLVINHINFYKFDNRKYNIEKVTHRDNSNRKHIKHSSVYTGVCWDKYSNKWRSTIHINKTVKFLGYFTDEFEASLAYESELININLDK